MFVARPPSEARIELVLPHVERRLCILASITRGWDARVGILGERCTARYTLRTYGDDRGARTYDGDGRHQGEAGNARVPVAGW